MTNCSSPAAICVWGSVTGHRSRRRRQRGASVIGGGRCDDVCVIELRTARLLLRAWTRDDADFLYDMDSRWEVRQYIGVSPAVMTDRSEALASIERRRALDHPVHGIWAIELLGEGALVGNLLLKPIPLSSGESSTSPEVEIGWHVHPDHWGNGYASEAGSAGLSHAFAAGLPRVIAVTAPENLASQRVCRRLGMRHLGRTGAYYNASVELYEQLKSDWPG